MGVVSRPHLMALLSQRATLKHDRNQITLNSHISKINLNNLINSLINLSFGKRYLRFRIRADYFLM